jgi:phosphate starvation-inducible PhoH-like protein
MDKIIALTNNQEARSLLGPHDEYIKIIEKEFRVRVGMRGENLKISGTTKNITRASEFVASLLETLRQSHTELTKADLQGILQHFSARALHPLDVEDVASVAFRPASAKLGKAKSIQPKTKGQRDYVEAIKKYDIVFGIGPAGTGKTYLAMAAAVEALRNQEVRRIILTRPAIEAGESLGFLPGDMYEKISPYLRPLYDALYDMMEADRIEKYIENGIIEVAPLAYMRGRTLNDAFIILDEAQNATAEQMKMFLTRLGFDSKVVITGDITQSDLPEGRPIGLLQAKDVLNRIDGIQFIYFTGSDVVRHELVQKIIEAYEKANREK